MNKAGSGATSLLGGNNFMKNLSQPFLDTILKVCSPDSMRAKNESGGTVNKKALDGITNTKYSEDEEYSILASAGVLPFPDSSLVLPALPVLGKLAAGVSAVVSWKLLLFMPIPKLDNGITHEMVREIAEARADEEASGAGVATGSSGSSDNNNDDENKEAKKPDSAGKMQSEVEKGQAPREVDRVDKPHVEGQKPHAHFDDGTSMNNDGIIHDKQRVHRNPQIRRRTDWKNTVGRLSNDKYFRL